MSTFLKSIAATVAMPHNFSDHELASAQQMNEFWRELRRKASSIFTCLETLANPLHDRGCMQMS